MMVIVVASIGFILLLASMLLPESDGTKKTARAVHALAFLVLALLLKS